MSKSPLNIIQRLVHSIRKAVRRVFPDVPYQLCQFHFLREAARPIYEADRHAKKELKKKVRGVRAIERSVEARQDGEAEVIRGYCSAVRSASSTGTGPCSRRSASVGPSINSRMMPRTDPFSSRPKTLAIFG